MTPSRLLTWWVESKERKVAVTLLALKPSAFSCFSSSCSCSTVVRSTAMLRSCCKRCITFCSPGKPNKGDSQRRGRACVMWSPREKHCIGQFSAKFDNKKNYGSVCGWRVGSDLNSCLVTNLPFLLVYTCPFDAQDDNRGFFFFFFFFWTEWNLGPRSILSQR